MELPIGICMAALDPSGPMLLTIKDRVHCFSMQAVMNIEQVSVLS